MLIDFDNYEYNNIVYDILENREFKKLESCKHHGINRLEHSRRVSYYSYKLCKRLGFDYVSAARGGLLHDFFVNNYKESNGKRLLLDHPKYALYNSKKHFVLNKMEEDIIRSHMFPIDIKGVPKYKESLVVNFIDNLSCLYERYIVCSESIVFKFSRTFVYMILLLNI